MFEDQHRQLEKLAYDAWLRRGRPIGSADADWEEACRILADMQSSHETDSPAPGSTPTDLGEEPVPEDSHDQRDRRQLRQ